MKLYWIYHFFIKSQLSQLNSSLVHASVIFQSHIEESNESVSALVTVLIWSLLLRASWYLSWILSCSDIFSIYQVYKNLSYLKWFYTLINDYFLEDSSLKDNSWQINESDWLFAWHCLSKQETHRIWSHSSVYSMYLLLKWCIHLILLSLKRVSLSVHQSLEIIKQ